jgi:hypothetical protein
LKILRGDLFFVHPLLDNDFNGIEGINGIEKSEMEGYYNSSNIDSQITGDPGGLGVKLDDSIYFFFPYLLSFQQIPIKG